MKSTTHVGSFKRKRRANQATRFLTKSQAAQHPSKYDKSGNPK